MKKAIGAAVAALAITAAGLVVAAAPASAATCGIQSAYDYTGTSSVAYSYKGCNDYRSQARLSVSGQLAWTNYGNLGTSSDATVYVKTLSGTTTAPPNYTTVTGTQTRYRYLGSAYMYSFLAH